MRRHFLPFLIDLAWISRQLLVIRHHDSCAEWDSKILTSGGGRVSFDSLLRWRVYRAGWTIWRNHKLTYFTLQVTDSDQRSHCSTSGFEEDVDRMWLPKWSVVKIPNRFRACWPTGRTRQSGVMWSVKSGSLVGKLQTERLADDAPDEHRPGLG